MINFYPLTAETLSKLYEANLTAAEWRLWIYFSVSDPWGDRYNELPDTLTILQQVGIKKSTFYAAIAKFQKFELFDFQDKGFTFRNLRGSAKVRGSKNTDNPTDEEGLFPEFRKESQDSGKASEKLESIPKFRNTFQKFGIPSKFLENKPPKPLSKAGFNPPQTIKISSDFSHSKEVEGSVKNDFQKETENFALVDQVCNSSNGLITPAAPENNSRIQMREPSFSKKPTPTEIEWKWLPDGPWKNEEGQLDSAFQTALAQRWLKAHGGDIHEKKANVLKHFRNEPTNLPIEWEWYQNIILHKAANIETRKLNGIDTTTDEQEILKHQRAGTELPQEMRVTEERSPKEILQEVAPHTLRAIEGKSDEFGQINPDSYQLKEFSADDRAFWQKIYSPQLSQAAQSINSSTKRETEEPTDLPSGEQKKAAKELIGNLRRRHILERKRPLKKQEEGNKNLTPIGKVIDPPAQTPFSVILEDMRKYLNYGSDTYRQIAIDWACDPINGCELVRASTGWIVDIRELDF
ncbi:hypothetical protein SAMD00079811_78170 (plasmid) [Scytonema sp. HK-05]|uniref:hypothetical protein n=1 Tax=Scytonema sp. HK-05 TaxID=1137095 RepID=UPI0009371D9D|nr:hypothetical protein [Scytonema sp. HK-05]OKH56547.1 hypothetical protein NIES2130_24660 [Scytonema sp. HK-05]BAY50188.1 hypothetical protein SAMD00079811_78170 [Scytonema sp. HK-05]